MHDVAAPALRSNGRANMLRVYLFGAFALTSDHPLGIALGGAGRRLASFLFSFPNEFHRREKILEIFWGEVDPDQARAALSTALWQFRRLLSSVPQSSIALRTSSRDVYLELADTSVVDVHCFQTSILNSFSADRGTFNIEALKGATDLYKAPFLEEHDDEWVLDRRERLQSLYVRSLMQLMCCQAQQRCYEDALFFGQRVLASDPMRETVQRAVMLLYVLNGQRGEAIRQFKRCKSTLRSECDVEPMPETQALFSLIQSGEIFQKLLQLAEKEFVHSVRMTFI